VIYITDAEQKAHEQNVIELAMTPGFQSLMSLANEKVQELINRLVKPGVTPSEQRIEDFIDIQSTIKGIRQVLDMPESIKKKPNQN
jgi:hypothetical protein